MNRHETETEKKSVRHGQDGLFNRSLLHGIRKITKLSDNTEKSVIICYLKHIITLLCRYYIYDSLKIVTQSSIVSGYGSDKNNPPIVSTAFWAIFSNSSGVIP